MTLPPFRVAALGELAIRCRDYPAMIRFYRDVIGLEVLREPSPGVHFFRMAPGYLGHTQVLALFADAAPPATGPGSSLHHLALGIAAADQDAARDWLLAQGYRAAYEDFPWIGWRGLFTNDPDGNQVELVAYTGQPGHVTAETLAAALPHVMSAPRDETWVTQLCFRPERNQRSFPDRLRLTRAEGVPGDRWLTEPWLRLEDGRPDPRIQVSILPRRVLDLVWRDRAGTPHPGDTIIADLDCSEANLPDGTLIRAGSAVLQVSSLFNEGCVKWKARYGLAAKDWIVAPGHPTLRLRGILCAVVEDGELRVGDKLVVQRPGQQGAKPPALPPVSNRPRPAD